MEIFASIGLIIFFIWLCKKDEWKANNRTTPPGMQIDYSAIQNDRILKGYNNRDVAIKKNQGGYDKPIKKDDTLERLKVKHPNWNLD